MKLAIAGLCFLGLIAAACAAVLVNGLRVNPVATAPAAPEKVDGNPDVRVLYATRNAPAMTVIDGSMVTTRAMPRSEAPHGYISDPVEVVGRVASQQVVAGQPFIKSSFADASQPKQLAAIIPAGKRAVTISVADYAGLEGLLFPGSMVDVMVSFKPSDVGMKWREALTATLLQNIQVLALDHQTVLAPGKMLDEVGSRSNGTRRVTLLVDTKQAKALELAMDQGTLSLALRNPLDTSETDKEIVSVHSLIGDVPPIALHDSPTMGLNMNNPFQAALAALAARDLGMHELPNNLNQNPAPQQQPAKPAEPPKPPHWDITVIHGSNAETQSFPMPDGKVAMGEQSSTK
jgi:pilus assembly protein CpaB